MPAAKLSSSGNLNAMKLEKGNDSLDGFVRQSTGKEPLLPFPRTVDSSVQWIQLLHALDQPDLSGWPLLPVKVQMQKCEKCSREFCSPINYRRHVRVHRRSLIINKEWHKNRDILAVFWDKLLLEQAREVVSFNEAILKDIPGSSIVEALASSLPRPGVWLPQAYLKAGAALLDIIQDNPSRLPISSEELFSILDDASERTFLCGGTAESVQKYIFYGETAKNSLELKNLVALASFLLEQQLVKAWVADKDVEALRCQKLLVEEEEAAQKRQEVLLERKKQKKLLQKEQKVREQFNGRNSDLNVYVDDVDRPTSAEASSLSSPSDSNSNSQVVLTTLDSVEPQENESDEDIETQCDVSIENKKQRNFPAVERQMVGTNGRHCVAPKSQRGSRYVQQANLNFQTLKPESTHKPGPSKDHSLHNRNKVWTKKAKRNNDGENLRRPSLQEVTSHQIEQNNGEVLIGSIPVALKSYVGQQQGSHQSKIQDTFSTEHVVPKKKNASEKPGKSTSLQSGKLWRPVSRGETKNHQAVDRINEDPKDVAVLGMAHCRTPSGERSGQSHSLDNDGCENGKQFPVTSTSYDNALRGALPFSSEAAKEFLAKRWKEAISGKHVTLVLSSSREVSGCSDVQHASDSPRSNTLNHGDNKFGRSNQVHANRKPEKGVKFKYIPKQKAAA